MVIGHTLMTNSFSPDVRCISILCSGAACPYKPAFMLQPLFSSVAMTARISVRGGTLHGLWNEFIITKIVCERQTLSTVSCAHLSLSCLCALQLYVCAGVPVFVRIRSSTYFKQITPFVVSSIGHSAKLVWFMDVNQNYISLRSEKDCPSSCCETTTTTTALNKKQIV